MQAQKQTLGTIFAPTIRLLAPLFQRPYVWQRDNNWQPLWEAVRDAADYRLSHGQQGHPYFLGAIVLNHVLPQDFSMSAWEIIDGQQRLTTLQVLLATIRDFCIRAGRQDYAQPFTNWTANILPFSTNTDERFKVWPTNVDREDFRKVMTAGSPFEVYRRYTGSFADSNQAVSAQGYGENDDPMVQNYLLQWAALNKEENNAAYKKLSWAQGKEANTHIQAMLQIRQRMPYTYWYFYAELREWLGDPTNDIFHERVQALYSALNQDIELIVIQLTTGDDAQQIFETLNALGAPLLPADLVKNYLFRDAEHSGIAIQPLYETYWKEFDAQSAWREKVRQGRLVRPRIDLFLQHYLALVTGDDVLISDMFGIYQKWARSQHNQTAADLLAHFRRYADVYWRFEHYSPDSREWLFFRRLTQLDNSTVLPLLLEVVLRHSNAFQQDQLQQILIDLESYLVRRLICGLSPKNYNRFFRDVVRTCWQSNDFSPTAIRAALLQSDVDTSRWPNDTEFKQGWMNNSLYRSLPQQRIRMILEALDKQGQSPLSEAYVVFKSPTIEHLLPQAWQAHWPLPGKVDEDQATKDREQLVHTIGNLTLLSGKLNTIISNGSWDKKLQHILDHSMSNINKQLPTVWNEEAIRQRGAALFENAILIWPYPTA